MTSDKMPTGTTGGTTQVLLAHHLKQLKLPTVLREYEKLARECARDGVDHTRYLLRLIELELIDRERRTVERRIRAARFPAVKSLDTFDFTAIPSLNKMLVLELARSEYILRRENVIALGNSGTGKTHVALALGLAAAQLLLEGGALVVAHDPELYVDAGDALDARDGGGDPFGQGRLERAAGDASASPQARAWNASASASPESGPRSSDSPNDTRPAVPAAGSIEDMVDRVMPAVCSSSPPRAAAARSLSATTR